LRSFEDTERARISTIDDSVMKASVGKVSTYASTTAATGNPGTSNIVCHPQVQADWSYSSLLQPKEVVVQFLS